MSDTSNTSEHFLHNGGECGELLRAIDWSNHPLGPPSYWPQSLKSTVGIILHSRFPMFLWWGNELFCFYNDAYRPSLGENGKHPSIMGQPAKESWPEIWDIIHPLIEQVLAGKGATWSEDQLIPIFRNGKIEDVYWTFSYSPVTDESGKIAGVLVTCSETTDKIRILQRLEESKNELEFAIDAAQLGTWDYNPENNKFKGNDRTKEWFGLPTTAEIDLQYAIDSVADSDRKRVVDAIKKALEYSSGGNYDIEYTIVNPDTKKETIVHAKGKAWFNEKKIAYRFNGTLEDVTEKATARKKIEEGNARFLNNITQAPVAMAILRGENHIVEVANDLMLEIWGHTSEEVSNKPIFEGLTEAKGQGLEELLEHVYTTGERFAANERPLTLPRGGKVQDTYINFVYESIKESDGAISGIVVIATDVTPQVLARTKIEDSEQKIQSLVKNTPFPMGVYIGREMRIELANQAILDIWGKGNDVIGKRYSDILPELDNQLVFEQLDEVYTTGIPFNSQNAPIDILVDGKLSTYYFNYSFTPLFDDKGNVYGVMNTAANVTDLNIAKNEIEASEARFRTMAEGSEILIAVGDETSNATYFSKAWVELTGRPMKELMEFGWADLLHPEDKERYINTYLSAFEIKDHFTGEFRILNKEGEYRWLFAKGSPLFRPDGYFYGYISSSIDITERKNIEEKIRKSQHQLLSLFEQSPVALAILEKGDFKFQMANKFYGQIVDRKPEDLLGKPLHEALPELSNQGFDLLLTEVIETGRPFTASEVPVELLRNSVMETLYVDLSYQPLHASDHSIESILVVCTDVTQQVLARKIIQKREQDLRSLALQAPIGICVLDAETLVAEIVNDSFIEVAGKPIESIIGKNYWEPFAEAKEYYAEALENVVKTGIPFFANETEIMLIRNGIEEFVFVTFVYSPLKDPDGKVTKIAVWVLDNTQQVNARRKVQESEHKFRTLIEEASVATAFYTGKELQIQYANDLMLEAWNKDATVIGQTLGDVLPEIKSQSFLDKLDLVFTTGEPYVGIEELAVIIVDGKPKPYYFNFTYKALKDKDGLIYGIHHMSVDVTEQVKSRIALSESEKKFRNTVKQAPVGITILSGRDYFVEMANDTYLQVVDRTEEEFVGRSLFDSLPEVKETVQSLLDEVMDTGVPFHGIEYPIPVNRFGKQEVSYFNFLYHPLKEDGEISGIIVTVTDVTESVKAKHALAESELQFRNMVMQSPIPMTIFRGKDFIVEMANKEMFENVWRKEESEVVGKSALKVFPELNDQKYPALLNQVLETGITHREIESPALVQGNDGIKKFYLDFEYAPLFETDRTVSGVIITVNDVTEKVEARHKVEESELYARSVFYNSPVAKMVFSGQDMVINTINENMLEILGRDSSIIGKPFMESMPELLSTPLMDRLRHVLATGETHHETEEKISFLKHGKPHTGYFDYIYKPLHNTAGEIYGIMCTCAEVTEQVISKQKIKESENRFRSLIEDAPVATCLFTGKDMVIEVANEIMLKYWGKDASVIGKPFLKALPEMEDQPFIGILQEIYETGVPYSSTDAEAQIMVDGKLQTFYFDFTYKPIYDSENNLIGIVDMAVDVTEAILAKKKLQESEQNFRTLAVKESLARQEIQQSEERARLAIDAAELGTYEWTIGTKETITSERFMYIFGFEWQEVFDREKLVQRIHPEDRHIHTTAHIDALKTGLLSYEARVVWPDESVHWIKIKGKIVYDEENVPKKMLGTVMDITDLKRIELALKTSESRLSEAQRIATIGNWEYGYNDKSFYCSDEVYRILATSAEEFVPSFYNLFRIIHPQDIKKLSRTLSFTSKTGLPFNIDFRIMTEDDNTKHINSQGYVLLDDNQKIIKIIGTLQDITMRKLVEEELIEAKRVSEKSLRYKEQFLANMSHEIRTPMNAIVGFTELILNTPLQTEQKQFLDAIKTSGENLLVIINDILDFSKVEAGAIHFEHIDFKLSEVVSTLTDLMLPKSVEKGIKLSVAINPAITDNLIGDPTRLNQILLNLVGNAIKFTEKGEIKIAVEPIWENDKSIEVKFAVSDTGIGIEEKMQSAIFDVFTQTSSDTTRKYGGSGLGLAIVKQFVEKQGGEVFLESSLGIGSTFSFTLTFDKSFTPALTSHKISEEPSVNTAPLTLSVLLVEDNKLNQLLANKALSDLGWKVDIADNGLIAIEKVAKNDYDIILMDIQLPEMDGYEATKYIRRKYEAPKSQIPIIAVTAHAMQSEAQKCHDAGMDGYISKPFSPKMLVEGILNVLQKDKKRDTPIH